MQVIQGKSGELSRILVSLGPCASAARAEKVNQAKTVKTSWHSAGKWNIQIAGAGWHSHLARVAPFSWIKLDRISPLPPSFSPTNLNHPAALLEISLSLIDLSLHLWVSFSSSWLSWGDEQQGLCASSWLSGLSRVHDPCALPKTHQIFSRRWMLIALHWSPQGKILALLRWFDSPKGYERLMCLPDAIQPYPTSQLAICQSSWFHVASKKCPSSCFQNGRGRNQYAVSVWDCCGPIRPHAKLRAK